MILLFFALALPPQVPDLPQYPPLPQTPQLDPYETLLARILAGDRVLVASGVPAPPGYESIEIPGEVGLFECWRESGKPMMRPMTQAVTVQRIVNQGICFT